MSKYLERKKLGDILSLEYGKPLPKEERTPVGKYPVFGANGIKCYTNTPYWKKDSIIVGRKGTAGAVTLAEGGFWPLDVTYFVTFDQTHYDLKYLYYLLNYQALPTLATGVKPGINRNNVYALECCIPSRTEQKRIVAILDEAFTGIETAIANTEKNLANARELFESYLNDIFNPEQSDWPVIDLSEIAKVKGGKRVPKGYKLQTKPTAYPYIAVSDFDDYGSVNIDGVKYVTKEVHDQIERYTITSNDVYISIAGTIGKSGIVPTELSGANLTENACKLELTGDASTRFVYLFTRTRLFMDQAAKNTRTTAQPKLALSRLKTIRLPLPPLEVQTKIVNAVDELRDETQRLEDIFKKKLSALAELKQSLLQKAFSGELTAGRAEREVESATV